MVTLNILKPKPKLNSSEYDSKLLQFQFQFQSNWNSCIKYITKSDEHENDNNLLVQQLHDFSIFQKLMYEISTQKTLAINSWDNMHWMLFHEHAAPPIEVFSHITNSWNGIEFNVFSSMNYVAWKFWQIRNHSLSNIRNLQIRSVSL